MSATAPRSAGSSSDAGLISRPIRRSSSRITSSQAWAWARRPAEASSVNRSEEHTSELQSLMRISYAVFCLQKNKHPQYHLLLRNSPSQRTYIHHYILKKHLSTIM